MASKDDAVSLIPLGGTGAIGKNMILLEQDDQILVIDAGLMFPDEDLLGVDIVIPDMTYLFENSDKVLGVILTHGHEDHIGAAPFLLERLRAPVWGTRLTLALLQNKLDEYGLADVEPMTAVEADECVSIGPFEVEFVVVNHSVPDGVGLGIRTKQGLIVHSGDFKFDQTPTQGRVADIHRLAAFGAEGVLALISDCTNVDKPGYTPSERTVGLTFEQLFGSAKGRIVIATFASNVSRIQQVFDVARHYGRKVAVVGRSMVRVTETAESLGYLRIEPGARVDVRDIGDLAPDETVILTTGSQGEPLSALSLMATGHHKHLRVEPGDTVIISASTIPGNEALILRTINNLYRQGAHVVHGPEMGVHVSGHGNQEDIKLLLSLVPPKYVIPYHGEHRHLVQYHALATEIGIPESSVFLLDIGDRLEFRGGKARLAGRVPAGSVNVDGLGVGDVGEVVLRDRQILSEAGVIVVALAVDMRTGRLAAGPEVHTRGFVYVHEAGDLLADLQQLAREVAGKHRRVPPDIKRLSEDLRSAIRKRVFSVTERRPMVLPAVLGVDYPEEKEGASSEDVSRPC
ncbi:MAG: ribonuclease J [Armatimonadota bacterium]